MTVIEVVVIGILSGVAGSFLVEMAKTLVARFQEPPPRVRVIESTRRDPVPISGIEDTLRTPPPARPVSATPERPAEHEFSGASTAASAPSPWLAIGLVLLLLVGGVFLFLAFSPSFGG